jgi:hypothetical protein
MKFKEHGNYFKVPFQNFLLVKLRGVRTETQTPNLLNTKEKQRRSVEQGDYELCVEKDVGETPYVIVQSFSWRDPV